MKELKQRFSTGAFTNLSSSYIPISKGIVFATAKIKPILLAIVFTISFGVQATPTVLVSAESSNLQYDWTAYLEPIAGIGPDVTDIETAPDGSVYAVGDMYGTVDFDPTGTGDVYTKASGSDVFITKRGSDGSYQWTRVLGDPAESSYTEYFPKKIAMTDSAGNIYLWGEFRGSVNFNPTGSDIRTSISNNDNFATKWNADGSYGWTHTFGAPLTYGESILDIEVSGAGDTYIAGDFSGATDFNAYGAGDSKTPAGGLSDRDAYVTKINSNGSYGWTQTFGGSANDYVGPNNLLLVGDGSGILVPVTFESPSIDADPGAGTLTLNQIGCCDMIGLIKLDFTGNLIWAYEFGNDAYNDIEHMTTDASGAIYAQGTFGRTIDFDLGPGTELATAAGAFGSYVLKYNQDGSYGWSKVYVGVADYNGIKIGTDGVYSSINYNNGSDWMLDGNSISDNGVLDSLLTKWDFDGNYQWSRNLGSTEWNYGYEFSINTTCDSAYVLADVYPSSSMTINFDQYGSDNRLIPDTGAFYITRYSSLGQYTWSHIVDTAYDYFLVSDTASGPNDSLYFAGDVEGTAINFDSTGGSDIVNTLGSQAVFISKISNTNYRQHVLNLDSAMNALETSSGDNAVLGNVGVQRTSSTSIQVDDALDNLTVAQIDADLSCDRDWTTVIGDSDNTEGKSLITGLTAAEGTASVLDLYVPVLADSVGVGICPGATTLSSINDTCGGYYELASGDPGLSTISLSGQDYWAVLGVSDGGAVNVLAATTTTPVTPPIDDPATPDLADTGASAQLYTMSGIGLLLVVYVLMKRPGYDKYKFYTSRL